MCRFSESRGISVNSGDTNFNLEDGVEDFFILMPGRAEDFNSCLVEDFKPCFVGDFNPCLTGDFTADLFWEDLKLCFEDLSSFAKRRKHAWDVSISGSRYESSPFRTI